MSEPKPPKVFISYSHKDEEWKNRLQAHLAVLEYAGSLSVWDDRQIVVGEDWYPVIEQQLNEANVAILLISVNFLVSKFIVREEIPRLLERRKQDGMHVIPLVLKPCPWSRVSWLSAMQGASKDNTPLSGMSEHHQEEVLSNLAERIDDLLQKAAVKQSQIVQELIGRPLLTEQIIIKPEPQHLKHAVETQANVVVESTELITKPNWASNFGRDKYGIFADLIVKDNTQRFRWLKPGMFLMGSPERELERFNDEAQHKVTLTQGFWLADTAVTQALWQVVMGNNPSCFKDDANNPVELVSWQDAQNFMAKLKSYFSGLPVQLPSEAQWEYACRAGSQTPFSFGENITTEQVNYNGNHPYADGRKGLYRAKTVAVKSLPANAWGLYEMHGNVWEWCQDHWQELPGNMPRIDPIITLSDSAAPRVIRGGSWAGHGRGLRSAIRAGRRPDRRIFYLGFRLALGHPAR